MLIAALGPGVMEFLLDSARFFLGRPSAELRPPPAGTAGNETLHSELKLWRDNKGSFNEGRMSLALNLFLLVEMITFFAAAAFACAAQMRRCACAAKICLLVAKQR